MSATLAPSLTITDAPPAEPASDWAALRAAGLTYVQQFGHALWTDYNRHDPGITLLELLCYAITDLSQRTALATPDLLRSAAQSDHDMAASFLTADQVLPTSPVTAADYRKLLLDVPGVRNAWLVPHLRSGQQERVYWLAATASTPTQLSYSPALYSTSPDPLTTEAGPDGSAPATAGSFLIQGLYDILVAVAPGHDETQVLGEVREAYLNYRNLGEDYVGLQAIPVLGIVLTADVDLLPEADAAGIYARLVATVRHFLDPDVPRHSLAELLTTPGADGQLLPVEAIFEGPLPRHGFVRDADLAASELREVIEYSDLMGLLMRQPGVRAVRNLRLALTTSAGQVLPPGARDTAWQLFCSPGHQLQLRFPLPDKAAAGPQSELRMFQNNRLVSFTDQQWKEIVRQAEPAQSTDPLPLDTMLPVPMGTAYDLTSYRPLALDFPATYGIGPRGLPADAPTARRAQARQLQAYLLFFDQLLTNYLAQLAHVKDLLTPDARPTTYFSQPLDEAALPELTALYGRPLKDIPLADLTPADSATSGPARKRQLLDHLLARFAESFGEYGLLLFAAQAEPPPAPDEWLVKTEAALAGDIPAFQPARAFRYHQPSWLGDVTATLNPAWEEVPSNTPSNHYPSLAPDYLGLHPFLLVPRLSFSTSNRNDQAARGNVAGIVRRFGRLAGMAEEDFLTTHWTALPATPTSLRSPFESASAEAVHAAPPLAPREAIYVVEHLLLRPGRGLPAPAQRWLDPGTRPTAPCQPVDPYSYQLTIVLPSQAARFESRAYQLAAERVLRAELPAHILAHVCWVEPNHLAQFEHDYHHWLAYLRGEPHLSGTLAGAAAALATTLNDLHHIYLPGDFPLPGDAFSPGFSSAFN